MSELRPVDLAALHVEPMRASRWCVTYPCDDAGHWREAYFKEKELADAYVDSHRGAVIVPLVNLDPWPK